MAAAKFLWIFWTTQGKHPAPGLPGKRLFCGIRARSFPSTVRPRLPLTHQIRPQIVAVQPDLGQAPTIHIEPPHFHPDAFVQRRIHQHRTGGLTAGLANFRGIQTVDSQLAHRATLRWRHPQRVAVSDKRHRAIESLLGQQRARQATAQQQHQSVEHGPLEVTWRDNATGQPVRIPCTNAFLAMTRLQHLLPFLNWPRPDLKLLRDEAVAGFTVGLMVIPQGVAYAALAGMPLQTGIYAAMLPALVAVLFSSSLRLSVGPTALTCLLVSSSLSGLATPGSAQWVELAMWLALLSGLLQVGLGLLRFGWLLNLVSAPVLMAFTQGAALLIISSQLPALLGLQGGWQGLATWTLEQHGQHWHGGSALFGVGALTVLTLARRWKPAFPSVLLVVLAAAGVSAWTGFEASGGAVVGQLPEGLPGLSLPGLPGWSVLSALVLPTLVITLVSFLETASSAKVDSERAGHRWNQNQDLIGQGLGKIASGLSGAFPTSSSFARSALNIFAGAQTGWATLASVIVVLLSLLFFLPVLRHVPQAVLAAIVLTAVVGLLKPRAFVRLWRISRTEAAIAGVTLALTLLTAPRLYWGVLAGVLMGLSHFLYQRLHPRIVEVGLDADGSLRDRHLWNLPPLASQVYALRMDAALEFASASSLEQAVVAYLSQHPDTRHVCLFAQPINRIDATGVECVAKLEALLAARQITLHISGMKLPVESVLRSAGCLQASPGLRLYRNDAEAVQQLQQLQQLQ